MPSITILDRLLKQLRVDEDKKKMNAAYLKYQSWFVDKKKINVLFLYSHYLLNRYVDLLQMIQPDYHDDHIIILLLKEMEEFASVKFYFKENN